MNLRDYLKTHYILLDGGLGTLLQAAGMAPGELSERWSLTHPAELVKIHRDYFDAGSHIVNANTFGASPLKFAPDELERVIAAALENARAARESSRGTQPKWIALDVGPSGRMLKPYGDLTFADAVAAFAETVRLGVKHGADLIFIETMNDSYETKAALLAAKEQSDLPVFVSNAYGEDGKLMTGASPEAMVAMLEGMRADAIGVNCSLGPKALFPVVREYLRCASVPVIFKPNAGLPRVEDGRTVYDVEPMEFAADVAALAAEGVRAVGGCCGSTPVYIAALAAAMPQDAPAPIPPKEETVVSSYTHAVRFSNDPVLIGERINPTGKKRMKQALVERDIGYILNLAAAQEEAGVHILDVNVGLPEIDEPEMLETVVQEVQAVTALPLQLDTSDPAAMERALRCYNGKALVNSVNGTQKSMDAIFPLVQKYGGAVVALTLDERGIPEDAPARVEIAKRILHEAEKYGIDRKDILFDTLTVTVSAEPQAGMTTLAALREIRYGLGCHTVLGVSNISFGLPGRDILNGAFYALALENGLSGAIINPGSAAIMQSYHAYRALHALDARFEGYIGFVGSLASAAPVVSTGDVPVPAPAAVSGATELQRDIIKGFKQAAADKTAALLSLPEADPLAVINEEIIPALNTVGEGFEKKTVYLPQLLMSAEASAAAFEVIKSAMARSGNSGVSKGAVVIATVHGDIHDIGKNIVKLLLENYGFAVTDLGKDVPPETVADAVCALHAPLAGLSALMTTTVPAMAETIRLLRARAPWCKICVGGAVLTADYAAQIGADKYAKDAMETVRYAELICTAKED
ncbi:MAG: homocysteine S-methyltransferase family protein [Oscillospiraceae bacterium]|nr:homocysteine S-methyltransferase family protein [Oscillospiraceae bacterium]